MRLGSLSKAKTPPRTTTASSPTRNGSSGGTKTRNPSTTVTNFARRAGQCYASQQARRAQRHRQAAQGIGAKVTGGPQPGTIPTNAQHYGERRPGHVGRVWIQEALQVRGKTSATSQHSTPENKTYGYGGPKTGGHATSGQGRKKRMGGPEQGGKEGIDGAKIGNSGPEKRKRGVKPCTAIWS